MVCIQMPQKQRMSGWADDLNLEHFVTCCAKLQKAGYDSEMPDFNRQVQLQKRTKQFALEVIRLTHTLPHKPEAWVVIGKQILRSSTSIAANYRAVARARSQADFVSKIGVVLEEADETLFWLELISEAGLTSSEKLYGLAKEAKELVAIFASSYQTARNRQG